MIFFKREKTETAIITKKDAANRKRKKN